MLVVLVVRVVGRVAVSLGVYLHGPGVVPVYLAVLVSQGEFISLVFKIPYRFKK